MAGIIGTEFRAKYEENKHRFGGSDWFGGLSVWSPNINIFRDPRWGRGQETYLPAFRATVEEGGAHSVMCAYNAANDVPVRDNYPAELAKSHSRLKCASVLAFFSQFWPSNGVTTSFLGWGVIQRTLMQMPSGLDLGV